MYVTKEEIALLQIVVTVFLGTLVRNAKKQAATQFLAPTKTRALDMELVPAMTTARAIKVIQE